jgi:hypothetical protein
MVFSPSTLPSASCLSFPVFWCVAGLPYWGGRSPSLYKSFNTLWCAGSTVDLSIPLSYQLPSSPSPSRSSLRRVEDDHAAVFQMVENLLSKYILYPIVSWNHGLINNIETKAKCRHLKRDFAAGVDLFEAPSAPGFLFGVV